jgi:hypothetical protein
LPKLLATLVAVACLAVAAAPALAQEAPPEQPTTPTDQQPPPDPNQPDGTDGTGGTGTDGTEDPGDESPDSTQPTQEEKDRYNRYCNQKGAEPSHSDKKFCDDFRKKYPNYGKTPTTATKDRPTTPGEEDAKKEDEPDSGPLAFTGLDIWQLLLIGGVLVAGGLGARRLLTN